MDKVVKLFDQDFDQIKKECLESGFLFQDSKFPNFSKKYPECEIKRPGELCDDPHFFLNKISRLDVQQGALGDCWMISAIANLTQHPKLFERVVPLDQHYGSDYAGIFRFRFWQYGKWVEVVVDDQLLVEKGELKFARSTKEGEFWIPLLEKAYAKLYGAYDKLDGGDPGIAMEDFTGGVAEQFKLDKPPTSLFDIMNKAHVRGSLIASCIYGDGREAITRMGLVKGHAYSITKVHYVEHSSLPERAKLIRVKNPWSNEIEWKGAWSDGSKEWTSIPKEERQELGLVFDNDGEFWICYEDFQRNFSTADICHLTLDSLSLFQDGDKRNWVITTIHGSFKDKKSHVVTLADVDGKEDKKCTLVVALMQKTNSTDRLSFDSFITCIIKDLANKEVLGTDPIINTRETVQRHELYPGKYEILPTIQGDAKEEYLLHIFTENPHHIE